MTCQKSLLNRADTFLKKPAPWIYFSLWVCESVSLHSSSFHPYKHVPCQNAVKTPISWFSQMISVGCGARVTRMAVPGKEAVSEGMQYDGIIPMEFYESSILEKVDIQREWLWGAFHFGFNSSPPWKARLECKCLANFVDCKSKIIYIYIYISTSSAVPHKLVQISLRNMYRVQLSATVSSVCINMYNLANFI